MTHKHFCRPKFYPSNKASAALAEAKGASCLEVWLWLQHTPETLGETCMWHHDSWVPHSREGKNISHLLNSWNKFIPRINLGLLPLLPCSLNETTNNDKRQPHVKYHRICLLTYTSIHVLYMLLNLILFKNNVTNFKLAFCFFSQSMIVPVFQKYLPPFYKNGLLQFYFMKYLLFLSCF